MESHSTWSRGADESEAGWCVGFGVAESLALAFFLRIPVRDLESGQIS